MSELIDNNDSGSLDELIEREGRIDRAQRNAYYEIGLELSAIKERELYKVQRGKAVAGRYSFTTWEEYVKERWDMDRTRSHRLIESALAAQKLENVANSQHL